MHVDAEHKQYEEMKDRWDRARHAYDGTDAVKAAGTTYLPPLDSTQLSTEEGKLAYQAYKTRALWYGATARTADGLAGNVHQKDLSAVGDDVDDEIDGHLKNVTNTTNAVEIDSFALLDTRESLLFGRYGIHVDVQIDPGDNPRPFWTGYPTENVINWREERRAGKKVLTRVVLKDTATRDDPKDRFDSIEVEQVRVLELDGTGEYVQWRFEKNDKEEWELVSESSPMRLGKPLNFIPFVLPSVKKPPLIDLVDVNFSWYRSSADREHALFWVSVPTPWVSGATGDEPLIVGGTRAWELAEGGRAGMLEHSGAGIGSIEKNMTEKKLLMATLGARLLEDQPVIAETATAVRMRFSGEYATLRTIAKLVERDLTLALRWHVWWNGVKEDVEDVSAAVILNADFENIRATPDEVRVNLLALQGDAISYQTFHHNLRNGGWTIPGMSPENELAQIKREGGLGPTEPLVTT